MNLDSLMNMQGQSIAVSQLADLNKALRAAGQGLAKATAGFPQQGVSVTGDFAPLIPQSIQSTLDTATYSEDAVKLWKKISKVNVTSTLHESAVVSAYGNMDLDPWISEGQVGPTSDGTYERKVVKIKFMAERREITDVATMVGVIGYSGVSRQGLAQQTVDGTRSMMGKLERGLFLGDSDVTPLAFDGMYKQIVNTSYANATGNSGATTVASAFSNGLTPGYTDAAGASITPQDLIEKLYQTAAAPNFGMVNTAYVDPRVYSGLVNIATAYGRFDNNASGGGNLVFGTEGLKIAGPGGLVSIESAPLMLPNQDPTSAAASSGENPPNAGAAVALNGGSPSAAAVASSKFLAADAGDYIYQIVGVGDGGITKSLTTSAVTVAAGDSVTISINDDGIARSPATSDGTGLRYYRVYRSSKNGAAGTCKYMWTYPAFGSAEDTQILDDNLHIPNTSPVFLLQMDPGVMYWAQLLDFIRRPLAQTKTTVPFLLMLFGAPHVKVPTKCHVIDNVSLTL